MGISPSSVSQNGVTAYLTLSGSTVTVEVSSTGYYWRINGTKSGGDHGTYYISETRDIRASFSASDNHEYAFQVCVNSSWSDGDFFTVTFDDSGGDDSGSSSDYCLYINQGVGTNLRVVKTWDEAAGKGYGVDDGIVMYSGSPIVKKDCFVINVTAVEGYTLNEYLHYYNFRNYTINYFTDNLTYPDNGDTDVMWVLNDGDARITTGATLKSYILSTSAETGSYITVTRISTRQYGAKIGALNNGDAIYHFDELKITFNTYSGYDISTHTVNGVTFSSGNTHTVSGAVSIISGATTSESLQPDYQIVNATKLESDLSSVANAIRTKGKTTDVLSFPDGFVSAVNTMQTGVDVLIAEGYLGEWDAEQGYYVSCGFRPDFVYLRNCNLDADSRSFPQICLCPTEEKEKITLNDITLDACSAQMYYKHPTGDYIYSDNTVSIVGTSDGFRVGGGYINSSFSSPTYYMAIKYT